MATPSIVLIARVMFIEDILRQQEDKDFYYMADIVRELWLVSLPVHNLRYGPQMLPTSPFARL